MMAASIVLGEWCIVTRHMETFKNEMYSNILYMRKGTILPCSRINDDDDDDVVELIVCNLRL